ncbi:MAG: hypothetical protein U5J64_09940 [Halobacteriales archaeon]|nr:hypothetical protein [Halobacteriales archaeon]
MKRRSFLLVAGTPLLSGCVSSLSGTQPACQVSESVEDPPDRVYLPTHREEMKMLGSDTAGAYEVSFSYTYTHRFWTVNGTRTERVEPADDETVHVMATVRDSETGVPLPVGTGASLRILRDGENVFERSPWLMVSQTMGFHLGDNVSLDGDGEYVAQLTLGKPDARLAGPLEGRFDGGTETAEVEFEYSLDDRNSIECEEFDEERWGESGAVEPMMKMGGRSIEDTAEVRADDDTLFTFENDDGYLAVHALTPHNRHALPLMSIEATVERDGETVLDDSLVPTVDARGYHYGAKMSADYEAQEGDTVRVDVVTPPQVSRHVGYQTAFLGTPTVEVSL